ncbi:hypothetical protein [Halobacterium litoreum]|uniref:Tat (Twin-arginine translocation) pathway signal sequence n=1 Tax=Halobacterium litoreum TaxID=2039234 RepID=A0ABD5NH17_9EURY|nr:hypothetical protein [Halobacterium litoreum]UHH12640.1 hypothetical protein LT972_10780 [Halobacterium litoreum]
MSPSSHRRGFLAVVGTGLAALTGAAARPSDCATITGSASADCGESLSLDGPESVPPGRSNARFAVTNDGDERVDVRTGHWAVYRREGGWERVAANAASGTVSLAPGEQTAWVLLLGGDGSGSMTTVATTTRYVGPVSLQPGSYAFVVEAERGGSSVTAAARFDVTE